MVFSTTEHRDFYMTLKLELSGIFSSFPVGAKFIRSLSHRDEAVCPHRNHIM